MYKYIDELMDKYYVKGQKITQHGNDLFEINQDLILLTREDKKFTFPFCGCKRYISRKENETRFNTNSILSTFEREEAYIPKKP